MQERRRYPRYPIKLPVHYRLAGSEGVSPKRFGRYWTKDVSLGGMRFEAKEELAQGARLDIELLVPKGSFSDFVAQDPMHLVGRVAWTGRVRESGGTYEIGVEFEALLEQDQERIEECIRFFLEDGDPGGRS